MLRMLFLAAMLVANDAAASSQDCDRPKDPGCPVIGRFENDAEIQVCKSEMENYKVDLDSYLACLDQRKKDAVNEYDESLDRFRCYAEGGKDCP